MEAIENVKAGDEVWAYDISVNKILLNPVLRVFARERDVLVEVNVGETTIKVTPEHPFFVHDRGWVAAEMLRKGDRLFTFETNSDCHVRQSRKYPGKFQVYNFEVEDLHNYFVAREGVFVHNVGAGSHHFATVGLGSKISYRSAHLGGSLNAFRHTRMHRNLNGHLRRIKKGNYDMMPRNAPGQRGLDVRNRFSRYERMMALARFYRSYQGGRYYPKFQKELRYLRQNPHLWQ